MIHVYTGEGKGKTTAAFGLALRFIGVGGRVEVVQFMKGRKEVGEFQAQKKVKGLAVHQFGRPDFVNLLSPKKIDFELAEEGLKLARKIAGGKSPPDLLVLDEANVAMHYCLLSTREVLAFMKSVPESVELVLTGRGAPKEIILAADLVTEMREVAHPYRKGAGARKGVEY
ncbi:MAG: cob(I)yrinic acid a,c-diamide adenosyltransferase [Candidatus ainarchaeum sp.]|nr:cob(I)yrinic acid a,c-diamide adenosyltransferase [Candidatus ainarchaeum sp.]